VSAPTRRVRDESDLVILELVRLGTQDDWSGDRAVRALLAKSYSPGALRVAHRRVVRADVSDRSRIGQRARETLRNALARAATA
jgi:hypothetical protein